MNSITRNICPYLKYFTEFQKYNSQEWRDNYYWNELNDDCLKFYKPILENVYKILDTTENKVELHFMTTVNVLSAPTFVDFLDLMQSLKKKYQISKHNYRIQFRVNYLTWPKCLSIGLLSQEDKEHYKKIWIDFANSHSINWEKYDFDCFNAEDLAQISRLCDYMVDKTPNLEDYNDFRLFISECDLRRNTNFVNVFPDLRYLLNSNYYGKQL